MGGQELGVGEDDRGQRCLGSSGPTEHGAQRSPEGSRRGQTFSSASKHKLANLGQQRIHACTEDGDETEVLFQIADVSKPLVSVSANCEMGNRVIFGKSGGVVKSLRSSREVPFYKENGIYVLSMWLMDSSEQDFARR